MKKIQQRMKQPTACNVVTLRRNMMHEASDEPLFDFGYVVKKAMEMWTYKTGFQMRKK